MTNSSVWHMVSCPNLTKRGEDGEEKKEKRGEKRERGGKKRKRGGEKKEKRRGKEEKRRGKKGKKEHPQRGGRGGDLPPSCSPSHAG